jgi:calcium-dependent protein kinase
MSSSKREREDQQPEKRAKSHKSNNDFFLLSDSDKPLHAYLHPELLESLVEISLDELGQGTFGLVRKGKLHKSGEIVAIKTIPKSFLSCGGSLVEGQSLPKALREVKHLKEIRDKVDSKYLLRFISAHEELTKSTPFSRPRKAIHVVTEFIKGGDLCNHLIRNGLHSYCEKDAARIMRKICQGVLALHNAGYIHRDLKVDNILIREAVYSKEGEPVIADFGEVIHISEAELFRQPVGTHHYMAPEICEKNYYSFESDIWALGVILYVIIEGNYPFRSNTPEGIQKRILSMDFTCNENIWSEKPLAKDLLMKILVKNPEERIKLPNLLKHRWIVDNDSTLILQKSSHNLEVFCNEREKEALQHEQKSFVDALVDGVRNSFQFLAANKSASTRQQMTLSKSLSTLSMERIRNAFEKVIRKSSISSKRQKISRHQFKEFCKELGVVDATIDSVSNTLFEEFDVDGSLDLDFREIITGITALSCNKVKTIEVCFNLYDINNDGYISRDELFNVLTATARSSEDSEEVIVQRITHLFEKIDVNGDGKISKKEFVEAFTVNSETLTTPISNIIHSESGGASM